MKHRTAWDRRERARQIAADSDRCLDKLELRDQHEGPTPGCARFLLQEPQSSSYWTEIVTLRGGSVLVHGDIATVVFSRSPYQSWRQLLSWMSDAGEEYACEKASIGGTKDARVFDEDVARSDVLWRRRQKMLTGPEARTLMDHLDDEGEHRFADLVYETTEDSEAPGEIGWCIGSGVLMAQAALRRLLVLLGPQ